MSCGLFGGPAKVFSVSRKQDKFLLKFILGVTIGLLPSNLVIVLLIKSY